MNTVTAATAPPGFLWAVGVEDTAIGSPIRDGGRTLDEYELTGHYGRWKDDLRRAVDLGCTALRYGLPWYRCNPAPGRFDWSFADDVLSFAAGDCGLAVIVDLVHYGTPGWLSGSFTDSTYPSAVAEWAGAVAGRYADVVGHITPLNEPLITASFCGQRGVWPPYDHGDEGWLRVVLACVEGIQAATAAIRSAAPATAVVHVEATHVFSTDDPSLAGEVTLATGRSLLPTDLLVGAVDEGHALYHWLLEHGAAEERLAALRSGVEVPDVIAVNYYPELSCRRLQRVAGVTAGVAVDGGAEGLATVVRQFHERYGLPMMIGETGVDGDDQHRSRWVEQSLDCVAALRADAVPVLGYTWWPLFDFIDWAWGSNGRVVEEFLVSSAGPDGGDVVTAVAPPRGERPIDFRRPMGLLALTEQPEGLITSWTAACDTYRDRVRRGPDAHTGPAEPSARGRTS